MAGSTSVVETNHQDIIHDTQFDYYGQLLATASSDGTVKIFSAGSDHSLVATLTGHDGPVWTVAWAHPRFGVALASASFDRRVIVWKETPGDRNQKQWRPVHIIEAHNGSVNCVAWAAQEYGSAVASASSDGTVVVTACVNGLWRESVKVVAENGTTHALGATAVSFAPYHPALGHVVTLATAGCDGAVRLWTAPSVDSSFTLLSALTGLHSDWVRDVAFNPDGGAPHITLASCGQDKKVVVARKLKESFLESGGWETSVTEFADPVWRLSWSPCGTMLLVTSGDADVVVLKQGPVFTDSWLRVPLSEHIAPIPSQS